jgi:hypothetical protein
MPSNLVFIYKRTHWNGNMIKLTGGQNTKKFSL